MTKKYLSILVALLFNQYLFAQVPTISSFSPTSGAIGTTVTITGTNFDPIDTNNIVFFGAVRAIVTNVNDTTLSVTVPAGTNYKPITVTTNGLTAYSQQLFVLTFAGGNTAFTNNSFAAKIDSSTEIEPQSISIQDLDGDGKPDIVTGNFGGASIYKNISTNVNIAFAQKIDYSANENLVRTVRTGDLDGDGKPDIVLTTSSDTVFIFKNTSTKETISFAPPIMFIPSTSTLGLYIGDIDGDGKPDIVIGGNGSGTVSVFRNITTNGVISFMPKVSFTTGFLDFSIAGGDLDGDGKPDIIAANADDSTISILRNTSIAGSISFAPKIDYKTNGLSRGVSLSDLDGDGKLDIITTNQSTSTISIFKNMSTIGNILFGYAANYITGEGAIGIDIADLDGDGRPDIVTGSIDSVCALRNISANGSLAFDPFVEWQSGLGIFEIAANDLNGDGKPEIISTNKSAASISILRNQIGEPIKIMLCPQTNDTVFTSDITGVNYQWQDNDGNGFNNIIPTDPRFIGINNSILSIGAISTSWYGYQFRCIVDGDSSNVYTLQFVDTWIGTADSTWENPANWSCGTLPDINTDVIINSGTVVLASNTAVRSISVNPNASFTIATGNNLVVTH